MGSRITAWLLVFSFLLVSSPVFASQTGLEKELHSSLKDCTRIIQQVKSLLAEGKPMQKQRAQLAQLLDEFDVTHLLMLERHHLRHDKSVKLGGKAAERQASMADHYRQTMAELLILLSQLLQDSNVNPDLLEQIGSLLQKFTSQQERPILGALPYRQMNFLEVVPLSAPTIIPAYQGGTLGYVAADLQGADEAQISKLIVDQVITIAAAAGTRNWDPVTIYEWIKNNIETEWYFGTMKGAEETLRQGSGNDADQSALLIAMLRAANYPARYVRGVVEFFPGIEAIKSLTGIDDPATIGTFFRKAGIPYQPVMNGQEIVNYKVEHIWVEALIPYANYRGAMADNHGKLWLPLDTSFKVAGFDETGTVDLYTEPDQPLATIRDDYLMAAQVLTPLETIRQSTASFLATVTPEATYASALHGRTLHPEILRILPSAPQFTEVAITGEYTSLPDELIHTVRFTATSPTAEQLTIFDVAIPTHQLSNQQIMIDFEPETVEDQEIINAWGGLDNTPAYLVRLRPVLVVNDERIVVGQQGFATGAPFDLTIDLASPSGRATFTNTIITGYPTITGIVAQKALLPEPDNLQSEAGYLLYNAAISYIDQWNQSEDELAELFNLRTTRPVPAVATLGGALNVVELLGEPQGIEWRGLFLDADLRAVETVMRRQADDDRQRLFMQLSALQGSVLENRFFEDVFGVESISTAKLFGLARDNLQAITTIDTSNADSVVPTLPFADNIKADITEAVQQGLTVKIPDQPISFQDWIGIGYLKENPLTGAAGYMLSGQIAGGMTAVAPENWVNPFVYAFEAPYTQIANPDPLAAYSIHKISGTDYQMGGAGQKLNTPLEVLVRDIEGRPVRGAAVTFSVQRGGGAFVGGAQAITVITDRKGIARTQPQLKLGHDIMAEALTYYAAGYEFASNARENTVMTTLANGTNLLQPFVAIAVPGAPVQMVSLGNQITGNILQYAGKVAVQLTDQYGNPTANVPIRFLSGTPTPWHNGCAVADANQAKLSALLTTEDSCTQTMPSWGECASSNNVIGRTWSNGTVSAGIVMGSYADGKYPVTASYAGELTLPPVTLPVVNFTAYTYSAAPDSLCGGQTPPSSYLSLHHEEDLYRVRPAGKPVKVRAKAKMLAEGIKVPLGTENLTCSPENPGCPQFSGDQSFDFMIPDSLEIAFNSNLGRLSSTAPDMYESEMALAIGSNNISVHAVARSTVDRYDNSCADGCAAQPTQKTFNIASDWSITYTGVAVEMPEFVTVKLNPFGFPETDIPVNYTIQPLDYEAISASFLIYQDGFLAYVISADTQGANTDLLPGYFHFDTKSRYAVQVVLNNNWNEAEIWSKRVPILLTTGVVDLQVEGLSEGHEDLSGTFVLLNNDFDEGKVDVVTSLPVSDNLGGTIIVQPDDEVKKAWLVFNDQGAISNGQWKLLVSDPTRFKVYRDDGAGGYQLVPLDTPQAVVLPTTIPLYIEGLTESSGIKADQIRIVFNAPGVPEMEDAVAVTVVDFDMAVDGDRNTDVNFLNVRDESSLFWVNNDYDVEEFSTINGRYVEDDKETGNDSADNVIRCRRDLEDFARLQIMLGQKMSAANLTFKMDMVQDEGTTSLPQINLFKAVDTTELYLGIGKGLVDQPARQTEEIRLGPVGIQPLILPAGVIEAGVVSPFLFEGRALGAGKLRLAASYAGVPVMERTVSLTLEDIQYFYDHFVVDETNNSYAPVKEDLNPIGLLPKDSREGRYQPESEEYVLFVHGWNVQPWGKRRTAETIFKRLWWLGFQGKVGLFDWPCRVAPSLDLTINFDVSEFRAWHSAPALVTLLKKINQQHQGQIRLLAHSQGNVAAGEAIHLGTPASVHSYVATQAALSASFYHQILGDILPALKLFSYDTPEVLGTYPEVTPPAPYLNNVPQKAAGHLFNYFNEEDYALTDGTLGFAWELNNSLKPDIVAGYSFIGSTDQYPTPPVAGEGFTRGLMELNFPADRYEIFSFAAESRTKALGAVHPTGNFTEFTGRDLNFQFDFNGTLDSHSRQFRSNIIDVQGYWQAFMADVDLSSTY